MNNPEIIIKEVQNDYKLPIHWRVNKSKTEKEINTDIIHGLGSDSSTFRDLLLNSIKNAKQTIMLSSFIISDEELINELINAADRKVRIYLLFSTNVQLEKEFREDPTDFDKKTLNFHRDFLDRIKSKALVRSGNNLHAKFMIIDYGTANQKGFISTANFTKEALLRNRELGIKLDNNEDITKLFYIFQSGFWEESDQQLSSDVWNPAEKRNLQKIDYNQRLFPTLKGNKTLKQNLIKLINETQGQLIASSYLFYLDNEVSQKIVSESLNRDVIILMRPKEKNRDFAKKVLENGGKVFAFDYIHAKFLFAPDNDRAIIMTANFDDKGLETGYEIGIDLNKEECIELLKITKNWIDNAEYLLENLTNIQNCKNGFIKFWDNMDLKQFEITEEQIEEEKIKIKDLRELKKYRNERFKPKKIYDSIIPKKIILRRICHLPTLPEKATKVKENPFKYPLYKHKNKRFLVLKKQNQIQEVITNYSNEIKNIKLVVKK
ncbi:MAG: hypothetical protein GF308_19495 [Candidatus Heimdallarchaeota archaeon]|nr:hypothetical protein [Candidatus Heimdallarchaeota archaeon]